MDAARRASILTAAFLALTAAARAADGMPDPVETIKEMIGAMTAAKPVRDTIVQRAFLSQDLLRLMGASKAERWRDFNADPILGTQDWSDWRLDKVVPSGNEVNAVFTSGKTRIQRDYVVVKDGADWRIDVPVVNAQTHFRQADTPNGSLKPIADLQRSAIERMRRCGSCR